jgi:hypothetical protein
MIEKRRVRLCERDAHCVAIDHVDARDRFEARAERRLRHEPLERVLHVVRGHFARVDGRLAVEAHAAAQVEDVDPAVLADRPLLGEVRHDRKVRRRFLLWPVGEAHELAVREAHIGVREKADRQMRVEARRLALGDAKHAAALRLLRVDRRRCDAHEEQRNGEQQRETSHQAGSPL